MHGFVPFPDERAAAYRAAGYWSGRPVGSLLDDAAASWPDRPAVIDATTTMSYAQLDGAVDRAAAALHRWGVGPGDRVLVQLPNGCAFAVTLFALLRVGAIPVLCLPGHRAAEIGHLAGVSDAVGIVIPDATAGFDYPAMAANLGLRRITIEDEPGLSPAPQFAPDPAAPALLLVSGGTTGMPKLIPRTHNDYVYNAIASAQLCELTTDDVYLVVLPAGHNFPLACPGLLGAMSVGATTVFGTDPSPEAAFATIARHRVTVTALVPALAALWAQACAWEPQRPTTLRLLQVGGAKLAPSDAARIRDALTPGLQQVFGMAEGLLCYTRPDDPADVLDTTQGRPLCDDDELRVVDEDGMEAPEGELLVRGPYTINGYYNAVEANARSFSPDGFYRSGDRVRRCANGYLEVTGRIKDVIVRGGENIAADELEVHLLSHPGIQSAAVVGLTDEYLGEKVCAAVVFIGAPLLLADLNRHLDECGVATHTRIDQLAVLPALPTTAVGKIDKKALARRLG